MLFPSRFTLTGTYSYVLLMVYKLHSDRYAQFIYMYIHVPFIEGQMQYHFIFHHDVNISACVETIAKQLKVTGSMHRL